MRYYDTARGNNTLLEFNLLYDSQGFSVSGSFFVERSRYIDR